MCKSCITRLQSNQENVSFNLEMFAVRMQEKKVFIMNNKENQDRTKINRIK